MLNCEDLERRERETLAPYAALSSQTRGRDHLIAPDGLRIFTTGVYGAGNYPNQDVYYLLICELAHRIWGDQKLADHVQLFLDFIEATVYPMGGMIYHGTQNECFGYHNLNISFLARFLEYTGNEQARRIIEKTVEFYPLMVEPSGRVEGYTDPSWKHTQPRVSPNGAARPPTTR